MIVVESEWAYEGGNLEDDLVVLVTPRALAVLAAASDLLVERIRAILNVAGQGRDYLSKRGDGSKHRASKPGDSPSPDRGEYRDSWEAGVEQTGADSFAAWAGTELWELFGRRLELGGYGGGAYIAPRPHARKAWDECETVIQLMLDEM